MSKMSQMKPLNSRNTTTNLYYVTEDLENIVYLCLTEDDIEVKARDSATV